MESERHEWTIDIHCQEITENGQDYAHFRAVHGTQGPPEAEFRIDGWVRKTSVETQMTTPRGPMTGRIDTLATGPGQSMTHFSDITDVVMAQQVTPIDAHRTQMRWQLYHLPGISEGRMRVTKARMRDLVKQVNQDIPIISGRSAAGAGRRADPGLPTAISALLPVRRSARPLDRSLADSAEPFHEAGHRRQGGGIVKFRQLSLEAGRDLLNEEITKEIARSPAGNC